MASISDLMDILLVNVTIRVEVCFSGEPFDIEDTKIALQ
jgi:hypothetical protein